MWDNGVCTEARCDYHPAIAAIRRSLERLRGGALREGRHGDGQGGLRKVGNADLGRRNRGIGRDWRSRRRATVNWRGNADYVAIHEEPCRVLSDQLVVVRCARGCRKAHGSGILKPSARLLTDPAKASLRIQRAKRGPPVELRGRGPVLSIGPGEERPIPGEIKDATVFIHEVVRESRQG